MKIEVKSEPLSAIGISTVLIGSTTSGTISEKTVYRFHTPHR